MLARIQGVDSTDSINQHTLSQIAGRTRNLDSHSIFRAHIWLNSGTLVNVHLATGQRNYVNLIFWRRGRSGFIEPKVILYNQSSIFFTFSPSPEGFTSSSTAASSDGRKNLMKSSSVLRFQLFKFKVAHHKHTNIERAHYKIRLL